MATLPNMLLTLPALGSDRNVWDDKLNACLSRVDAHDHTTGNGVAIRSAAISIDVDLPFNGQGATQLRYTSFIEIPALTTGARSLFVNSTDHELYWRTASGTNVKLTAGNGINTALVGGIVGDYTTAGAEVAYDDANGRYTFKRGGTKPWARLASGPVRMYEYNTTEAVYVELAAPATLAASYSVALPVALPASTALMQVTSGGVASFSNTIAEDITFAAGKKINHGLRSMSFSFYQGDFIFTGAGVATVSQYSNGQPQVLLTLSTGTLTKEVPSFRPGDRIQTVKIAYNNGSVSAPTLTMHYCYFDTPYSKSLSLTSSTTFGSITVQTYTVDIPEAIGVEPTSGFARRVSFRIGAPVNNTTIYAVHVGYDSITPIPAV